MLIGAILGLFIGMLLMDMVKKVKHEEDVKYYEREMQYAKAHMARYGLLAKFDKECLKRMGEEE